MLHILSFPHDGRHEWPHRGTAVCESGGDTLGGGGGELIPCRFVCVSQRHWRTSNAVNALQEWPYGSRVDEARLQHWTRRTCVLRVCVCVRACVRVWRKRGMSQGTHTPLETVWPKMFPIWNLKPLNPKSSPEQNRTELSKNRTEQNRASELHAGRG